jgi:hypothetical protein
MGYKQMHRRFPPESILDIMNKKYEKVQSIVRLGEMEKCPRKENRYTQADECGAKGKSSCHDLTSDWEMK